MMFRKEIICLTGILVWAAVWLPLPVWAENPSKVQTFDLAGCIRQALRANPKIAEAGWDVKEADLQLKSAKFARTPTIELFNRSGIAKDAIGDGLTGEELDNEYGPFNRLNVMFTLPIYTFGRISHGIHAAGENLGSQKAAQAKTVGDLLLDVHRRYYGHILARQMLATTDSIRENFAEAYEVAEERLHTGDALVTETDALKLKVGLAVVTGNLYTVQREVRVSKAGLREIMGLADGLAFEIHEERLDPVAFDAKPISDYINQAMETNPDIAQIRAAVSAEEARYRAERSRYYPTFLALGGLRHGVAPGRDDQDNPFLNDEYNFFNAGVYLGIKWNLDFWQTHTDVDERRVGYLRMQSRLEKAKNAITLLVEDKYHRYMERKNNLEASFEAKKAGRALLFLNLTSFKLGIGSGKDVFDALSLNARVDGDYYKAIFDYNVAVVELLNAVGRLEPDSIAGYR